MNDKLYSTKEAAEMLNVEQQTVSKSCKKYSIGRKVGENYVLTLEEIETIRNTDGRRKKNKEDFDGDTLY